MASTETLRLRIEGMDCGACALKIEHALSRLPGASDISVDFGRQSLALSLSDRSTSLEDVKAQIRSLGFNSIEQREDGTAVEAYASPAPWWQSRKAGVVAGTGALLLAAYLLSLAAPKYANWLFTFAALVGLAPISQRAFAAARAGFPFSIETLMSIAAVGAIAIGAAEEAVVVVFLFAVGELLETVAADRARSGIRGLIDLMPRTATRRRPGTGEVETVAIDQLGVGDTVVVVAGDRIPSDGIVIEGVSEADESPVTGESVSVAKQPGSAVYAGTINANGELHIRLTRSVADNTIARIIQIVEEAQSAKAPTARFIDQFSRWYTPAAIIVALLVVVVPPLAVDADWQTWIYRGLAILLIACPCALVISTPAAIASGLAAGARQGLLIKGGAALETLGKVTTVAFDKTGTLTAGAPKVTDVVPLGADERTVISLAAAVERGSKHPLARAIVTGANALGAEERRTFGGATAIPGKGITARLDEGLVTVASPRHAVDHSALGKEAQLAIARLESEGKTVVVVIRDTTVVGLVGLRDEPRADAALGLQALHRLGVRTVMLSGDNARTAAAIGHSLNIDAVAELLPQAKLEKIATYKAKGPVAMVGDGINDAPALAAASVGIAMGSGTDVALEAADAALLNNRVGGIADLVVLSRATLTNIWQNIALALGLKAVFLVTTLMGATTLWMAILADTGATVLVTANALRLLRFRPAASENPGGSA